MTNRNAIILAAGKGTRMKSSLYKVLHPVCGKPMVEHVIENVSAIKASKIVTIIGHGAEEVKEVVGSKTEYALQAEQLGTAHAVMQAKDIVGNEEGTTLVICGDTPLITAETLEALLNVHDAQKAKATILTARTDNPAGYGRVIRNDDGLVEKIVEHKDASPEELLVQEINTGTYCFDNKLLFECLENVSNENAQGEYYLPDVIEILKQKGEVVSAFETPNFDETLGINDRIALSQAEKILKRRINEGHMRNGVTIIDPDNTYIHPDVVIGSDTYSYPGTMITGKTTIGGECHIGPNTEIKDCEIQNRTVVRQSVAHDSQIGSDVQIGPFSHIRPQSAIHDEAKIGNFVELKKTTLGKGSKASHLSYLGDAEIGERVNVGCGSITVNYDGKNKFLTRIEDGAFIGCNSNLVAPVTVGKSAYVAAGSTITKDVPGEALSVARARQVNKENYVNNLNINK